MKNRKPHFETLFWQRAYESLPEAGRRQHLADMQAAERWELALGSLIELGSRAKNAIGKLFHTPSRAH